MSTEKNKKQAALETLWFMADYGDIISAFALAKTVENAGYNAVLLNKPFRFRTDTDTSEKSAAGKFIYKNCIVAPVCYNSGDFLKIEKETNVYITGTHPLWSYALCGKEANFHYYFEDVSDSKKKISYATGFGGDYTGPDGEDKKLCIYYLKRYAGVSVGDYNDAEIMGQHLGIEPKVVLNPILMCDRSVFEKASENAPASRAETADSFVFAYIKNCNARKRELVVRGNEIIAEKSSNPMRTLVGLGDTDKSKSKIKLECSPNNSVEDYLYYIIHSEFVITDDLSTVCLAVLFNKPFVFTGSETDAVTRQVYATLFSLGIDERIVLAEEDYRTREYLFRMPVRYNKVNKLLAEQREASENWLKSYLV